MKPSTLLTRIAGAGLAVAMATTLAACASSGGSNGAQAGNAGTTPGTTPANTAPANETSSSAESLPGKGAPPIVMGDKNFAEEYLLGELYTQALHAKGFTVTLKGNIGSSAVIDKALTTGKIDMYPEYTGVIYTELASLGDRPKSAAVTYAGAKKWEAKRGFAMLEPTAFQDKDGVAVLNAYAEKNSLKTIGDLKNVGSFTYGGPPENATRFQGVVGLKQVYGLNQMKFKPLKIGIQYTALDQKKVDTIAIFTTDGQLASGKYTVLDDDQGIFGYQQVAPVISQKLLDSEPPAFADTLNAVTKLLSEKAIIALNKAVQIDQKKPADVAKAFLQANGML